MLVGQTLQNRYHLVKQIGQGAFGQTYQAQDRAYRSTPLCVVKHLKPDDPRPEVLHLAQNFFQREVCALGKLGKYSDQIPTLIDHFQENNEFYLVEEWIDGKSLAEILPIGKKLTQVETIDLMIKILEPLVFCHQEAVIHRDIKPGNIMTRDRDGKLVLIDFGAVKEITQASSFINPGQQQNSVIGTPGFMPLEQYHGHPLYASDIYAVGMLGIQALTGTAAHLLDYDDQTSEVQWRNLCYVTQAFATILEKMVKPLPMHRYAQAQAALTALRSLPHKLPKVQSPAVKSPPPVPLLPTPPVPSIVSAQPALQEMSFVSARVEIVEQIKVMVTNDPGFWGDSKQTKERRRVAREAKAIDTPLLNATYFVESIVAQISMVMVKIPAGQFLMGSPNHEEGHGERESPQHLVSVPEFFIGQTLVTQAQWQQVMGNNPAGFKGNLQLPVESVNRLDAELFCDRLSQQAGRKYRLPSEAEWEYACRAGSTTPFGYGETITTELANFDGKHTYGHGSQGRLRYRTTPVGYFPPNSFGLYDMHGNLWEWCADHWHSNYLDAPIDGSIWQGTSGSHVLRGGTWNGGPRSCRSACRVKSDTYARVNYTGFRVVYAPSQALP
jgi:eukaryotic-like serine/threonine-protein kinase